MGFYEALLYVRVTRRVTIRVLQDLRFCWRRIFELGGLAGLRGSAGFIGCTGPVGLIGFRVCGARYSLALNPKPLNLPAIKGYGVRPGTATCSPERPYRSPYNERAK